MNPKASVRRVFVLPFYILIVFALIWALTSMRGQNLAGDMVLSKVLIQGAEWELLAEGLGFTDGACADAEGNFYFYDLGKNAGIQKIDKDGKLSVFLANTPRISGLKFGADGRFYACTQGPKKQVVSIAPTTGDVKVLADNVEPNDLVVSYKGHVYFTETGKGQVTLITASGEVKVGATGINRPNGITLSPDQGTLAVSEYGGTNVWVYRIETDGTLKHGAPYMELRAPVGKTDSGGDGMTTDTEGRYYVTSNLGIQMFDATGRMGGIIARPQEKGTVSATFAGPGLEYLYVCSSDKIYRRKTQAKGVLFFVKL